MDFLKELIQFLNKSTDESGVPIVPPEVSSEDNDREKSYLDSLPSEPNNVYVFKIYNTKVASLVNKQAGVHYVQLIVRNESNKQAYQNIERVWKFLLNRPEFIEDINPNRWVIFDVRSGPIKIQTDEKGNHLWSLSFPVKTSLF